MELRKSAAERLISMLLNPPDWMQRGNCIGRDIDPLNNEDAEEMKRLCSDCPVLQECKEKFFEEVREGRDINYGVFHGLNYYENEDIELEESMESDKGADG